MMLVHGMVILWDDKDLLCTHEGKKNSDLWLLLIYTNVFDSSNNRDCVRTFKKSTMIQGLKSYYELSYIKAL